MHNMNMPLGLRSASESVFCLSCFSLWENNGMIPEQWKGEAGAGPACMNGAKEQRRMERGGRSSAISPPLTRVETRPCNTRFVTFVFPSVRPSVLLPQWKLVQPHKHLFPLFGRRSLLHCNLNCLPDLCTSRDQHYLGDRHRHKEEPNNHLSSTYYHLAEPPLFTSSCIQTLSSPRGTSTLSSSSTNMPPRKAPPASPANTTTGRAVAPSPARSTRSNRSARGKEDDEWDRESIQR